MRVVPWHDLVYCVSDTKLNQGLHVSGAKRGKKDVTITSSPIVKAQEKVHPHFAVVDTAKIRIKAEEKLGKPLFENHMFRGTQC